LKPSLTYDLDDLNRFAKAVSKDYRVKIGILGSKDMRKEDGQSNASIGLVHEFGSFSRNIPPRSFLRMPLRIKSTKIIESLAKTTLKLLGVGNYKQVFKNLGIKCEEIIEEAFDTSGWGAWAPNTHKTVMSKTPSKLKQKLRRLGQKITGKPLIDTGALRRSITSKVEEVH
jgi:phage gpG-like protein